MKLHYITPILLILFSVFLINNMLYLISLTVVILYSLYRTRCYLKTKSINLMDSRHYLIIQSLLLFLRVVIFLYNILNADRLLHLFIFDWVFYPILLFTIGIIYYFNRIESSPNILYSQSIIPFIFVGGVIILISHSTIYSYSYKVSGFYRVSFLIQISVGYLTDLIYGVTYLVSKKVDVLRQM